MSNPINNNNPPLSWDQRRERNLLQTALDFLRDVDEAHSYCHPSSTIKNDVRSVVREFANNREVVLAAAKIKGMGPAELIEDASDEFNFKNDKEFMLNFRDAELASDELKNDHAFMIKMVEKAGYNLRYASQSLRGDPSIVSAAIGEDAEAFEYASDEIRGDNQFFLQAMKDHYLSSRFVLR